MFIVRKILGALILFFDWLFTPKGIKRDLSLQAKIDQETARLALYQFAACPFCVKVRRAIKRQSLKIKVLDAKNCEKSRNELMIGGGKIKVPCLKIICADGNVRWIYESKDIVNYLESCFE